MLVARMDIAPTRIRLPDFDQRVRHRAAVVVEHPPRDADALAYGFTEMLAGEVVVVLGDFIMAENRSRNLRQRVWKNDERLARCPKNRGSIRRIERWRLRIFVGAPIRSDNPGMLSLCYRVPTRLGGPDRAFCRTGRFRCHDALPV